MRVPLSITQKLLIFVLPLVCLPTAVVGYLSYNDSVERVTYLSREQQLLQAKSVAKQIDDIFQSCMRDLETISELSLIEDYQPAIKGSRKENKESLREQISRIFRKFLAHSSYYSRIRILETNGLTDVDVGLSESGKCPVGDQELSLSDMKHTNREDIYVSKVTQYPSPLCSILYFSKPLLNDRKEYIGDLVIDLNYNKVVNLVRAVGIGEKGYAFIVDDGGNIVVHPQFRPYEYNLSKYTDPRLREFVVNMIAGESGWEMYHYLGEKAAAYAPIRSMGWSVAVCIPIEEFKKDANLLRKRMIEGVTITLLLAILAVIVLSYNLVKPVKRLVTATERIAKGDLHQKIPVKSGDELGVLTRSFNRMVSKLSEMQGELVRSEKLISMGRLSAGVAHEIRNPLNAMKGAIVYLIRKRPDDGLIQEYSQLLLEEVERLNQFVTEFLYFARQSVPNPVPINVNELLDNTLFLFDEKLKEKTVTVVKRLDGSLPLIQIDPYQIEQVIINLLMNALDAMSKNGKLEISTALQTGHEKAMSTATAVIAIMDNGVGISEEEMNSIFDPFFSTKETGTGLGLPISLGIVENHGGSLLIKSRKDEGTMAVIELPVHVDYPDAGKQNAKKNPDC